VTSPRPRVSNATARRLFQLVEPIAVVTYLAPEPTEAVMALGAGTMWDAYFAPGPRAGPDADLRRTTPSRGAGHLRQALQRPETTSCAAATSTRPEPPVPEPIQGKIRRQRRPILGGLINHYEVVA
jgi:hypothetical protein